ncbi:MAG: ATP-binding protein [Clostridia bacterium]
MFNSMRMKSGIMFCITIGITAIVTTMANIFMSSNGKNFAYVYISVAVFLILLAIIMSYFLTKEILLQFKRYEKNMKSLSEGRLKDTKIIKERTNILELQKFTDSFNDMVKVIRKNLFDLNTQQSKTEIILEHMADGVVAFSASRQIVHMNKSAIRLLNVKNSIETYEDLMKQLMINIQFDQLLYMPNYKSKEQKVFINDNVLNVVFAPFYSERLSPIGVIMVVKNITESVKLDNMRKDFVATVSHEFKTPLTSIKGYSETIIDGDLTKEEIKKFSQVINDQANRMDRLVVDLLQLSRYDHNKVSWRKMMFNLEELTKKVVDSMQIIAIAKNHKLECIVTNNIASVYADRDSVEQVIVNIITNSIKYTPDGGTITVYVGMANSQVYLKFIDTGVGIPEKDLKRIFERFYRVDKARSREMGGTGLGLAIVKEIVEGNNGTIDIASKVNEGTTVTVMLPTKIGLCDKEGDE